MKLRDTLSRQLQPVTADDSGVVSVYSCGPTVYDYPHLGNWYAFLRWDLLIRTLRADGFKPVWVMNITDVGHLVSDGDEGEDKLAKKARSERKTAYEVADFYTSYFLEALKRLNFTAPDHLPKASQHIEQQISLIEELEKKGFTYLIDDGVYYDTAKLADYGKLAKLDKEGVQAGARVEFNPQKRNATDFALWKLTPANQVRDMEWDSPWGKGFPGWHLECSAMCRHYLGQPINIHAGGIDHIPVHHTNELAQSEAAYDRPLAKIWLHSDFITVNGEKMSKSLNNFYTLEDIEAKGYDLRVLRLAVFSVRYRSLADFNWDMMEAADRRLSRLQALSARRYQLQGAGEADVLASRLQTTLEEVGRELADDLNSPKALEKLDEVAQGLAAEKMPDAVKPHLEAFIREVDEIFGLKLSELADLRPEQRELLDKRAAAREVGDFNLGDRLREELSAGGIKVLDTDYGQIWRPS
ncbi:cysteine--tRNA ligase [Candidatus Saccharibacteria bacterium]|nr:cysteine--tRNA ligase [Candidatus Saccharibacteria bacterium]